MCVHTTRLRKHNFTLKWIHCFSNPAQFFTQEPFLFYFELAVQNQLKHRWLSVPLFPICPLCSGHSDARVGQVTYRCTSPPPESLVENRNLEMCHKCLGREGGNRGGGRGNKRGRTQRGERRMGHDGCFSLGDCEAACSCWKHQVKQVLSARQTFTISTSCCPQSTTLRGLCRLSCVPKYLPCCPPFCLKCHH